MTFEKWFLVGPPKDVFSQVGILGEAWVVQKKHFYIKIIVTF
jgi:hypothetical protein